MPATPCGPLYIFPFLPATVAHNEKASGDLFPHLLWPVSVASAIPHGGTGASLAHLPAPPPASLPQPAMDADGWARATPHRRATRRPPARVAGLRHLAGPRAHV